MPEDDTQEVVFHQEGTTQICPACEDGADEINRSRAAVIRFHGYMIASIMPLVTVLTFLNSLFNHESWKPDATIITAMIAAIAYIGAFAWKTRHK